VPAGIPLQLQSKLAEARSSLTRAVDPVTGKRLFHPATGRAPTTIIRHGAGQAVCQKLYKLKQQQDEKVSRLVAAMPCSIAGNWQEAVMRVGCHEGRHRRDIAAGRSWRHGMLCLLN
jgi:hypothetical protein